MNKVTRKYINNEKVELLETVFLIDKIEGRPSTTYNGAEYFMLNIINPVVDLESLKKEHKYEKGIYPDDSKFWDYFNLKPSFAITEETFEFVKE